MYQILPLIKSHYSLGKSILTLEKPWDASSKKPKPAYLASIFDHLIDNKLDTLVLVEDNISGLLQASKQAKDSKIKLIYGLRIIVTEDIAVKDEARMNRRAKYIIFAKNPNGYKSLVKLWSIAAKDGFYYKPMLDFKVLKSLWSKDLKLVVPFYDSFLHLNTLNSHVHVPDFNFTEPTFLTEDNDLPFDYLIEAKVADYAKAKGYNVLPAQSIYYKSPDDFEAYLTFRCIHNRSHNKSTLEKPELEHMGSNQFNFDKWLKKAV